MFLCHFSALAQDYSNNPTAELKGKILTAVRTWINENYKDENWWHRAINYPKRLVPTVLYLYNEIKGDSKLASDLSAYLLWSLYDNKELNDKYRTGANLTDIVQSALPGATLRGDKKHPEQIQGSISTVLNFQSVDGIHVD